LELISRKYLIPETRKCFIVAHSFGTLAVVRALEMHVPNLKVDGLILLGSIVPRDYYWDGLVSSKCLLDRRSQLYARVTGSYGRHTSLAAAPAARTGSSRREFIVP
jgi:alpha-beta hydrolase superfamily lysophospholipase